MSGTDPDESPDAGEETGKKGPKVSRREVVAALAGTSAFAALGAGQSGGGSSGGTVLGIGGGSMADAIGELRVKTYVGTMAERPSAGVEGRVFKVWDPSDPDNHGAIFYDDGTAWELPTIGSSGTPVPAVHTEDLDIDDADFVASGDFLPLFTWHTDGHNHAFSNSTYGQLADTNFSRNINWADFLPSDTQIAVGFTCGIFPGTDETVSVKLRNTTQGEDIVEVASVADGDGGAMAGYAAPTAYTPTTRDSLDELNLYIKTDPGSNSSSIDRFVAYVGVQL